MNHAELARRLSLAYWPNPSLNESANRELGNAAVDALTLAELSLFFSAYHAGPTYCMVKERVQDRLKLFPPHIEDRKARAEAALDSARRAYLELQDACKDI